MEEPNDDVPRIPDYGSGVYRRRIRIEQVEKHGRGGVVVGELEDDFHHFRARVTHDGQTVTAVEGQGLRIPWTTCAGATEPLTSLIGIRYTGHLAQSTSRHQRWLMFYRHFWEEENDKVLAFFPRI